MTTINFSSLPPTGLPRILVVENDEEIRAMHVRNLEYWGYVVYAAVGYQDALLFDAQQKARQYRCHLALVDIHLRDDHDPTDTSGLELSVDLRPTRTIFVSGSHDLGKVIEALKQRDAITYILKSDGPQKIQDELSRAAEYLCACRSKQTIRWADNVSSKSIQEFFTRNGVGFPQDEINDLLYRLFPKANELFIDFLSHQKLSLSNMPRRASISLEIRVDEQPQPFFVKISSDDKTRPEMDNYRRLIENRLGNQYVPVLRNGVTLWDIGGAVYTLLGSDTSEIEAFSNFFLKHDADEIEPILKDFFTQTWYPHYQRQTIFQGTSLFDAYSEVWNRNSNWYDKLLARYHPDRISHVTKFFGEKDEVVTIDPVDWLNRRLQNNHTASFQKIHTCVIHGDLRAENLLVDAKHQILWAIDFEYSSTGHVLQDFVRLEIDILTKLIDTRSTTAFYDLCLSLVSGKKTMLTEQILQDKECRKAYDIISALRQIAVELTGFKDYRIYFWGLLLTALYSLIEEGIETPQSERALFMARLICARLEHWNSSIWPLPGWPTVQELHLGTRLDLEQRAKDLKRELRLIAQQINLCGLEEQERLAQRRVIIEKELMSMGEPAPDK